MTHILLLPLVVGVPGLSVLPQTLIATEHPPLVTVNRLRDESRGLVFDVWFGEQVVTHAFAVETSSDLQQFLLVGSLAEDEVRRGDVFGYKPLSRQF